MSIGLITITHNRIGAELLDTARQIIGELPLVSRHFEVTADAEPGELSAALDRLIREIDRGDGVLILTDLYGSTPCNVARQAAAAHTVLVVSGLNLPMLLRAFNYARLDLAEVAARAAAGGRRGIVETPGRPA